jgi:hypothetical protein
MSRQPGKSVAAGALKNLEEEAFLGVIRTAEAFMWGVAETLKLAGLTPTQYNILRILRGGAKSKEAANALPKIRYRLSLIKAAAPNARNGPGPRVVLTFITKQRGLLSAGHPATGTPKTARHHLGREA